jgi:sec-independent protein translocase protein TatC
MKRLLRILTAPLRWIFAPFRWLSQRLWEPFRRVHRFFTEVPPDDSLAETLGGAIGTREGLMDILAGLGEHLEALRKHLFRAVVVLALATAASFWFSDKLMMALAMPLGENAQAQFLQLVRWPLPSFAEAGDLLLRLGADGLSRLQVIEPTESVGVFMRVSLLAGVAFAMPWIVMELYLFIAPGLMPPNRLRLLFAIPLASLFFVLGLLFTYVVMLPTAVPFLYTFAGFKAAWRPSAYFGLVTGLMFWIGVVFQMPLLIYAGASVGLIRAGQLAQQWKIAVVVIAIIAAAVTPTVDPVSMGVVMLPMILLYGFSIVGAVIAEGGHRKRVAARERARAST